MRRARRVYIVDPRLILVPNLYNVYGVSMERTNSIGYSRILQCCVNGTSRNDSVGMVGVDMVTSAATSCSTFLFLA